MPWERPEAVFNDFLSVVGALWGSLERLVAHLGGPWAHLAPQSVTLWRTWSLQFKVIFDPWAGKGSKVGPRVDLATILGSIFALFRGRVCCNLSYVPILWRRGRGRA